MSGHDLAVVQGWADTRATLRAWNAAPWLILRRWLLVSVAIALGLLGAVLLVANASTPDPTRYILPGVNSTAGMDDVTHVLGRNLLVLALHSLACLAGFIAKSSLPLEAQSYTGHWRRVHDLAGPGAIAFVTAATLFSLGTQAIVLGGGLSTLAAQFGHSPGSMLAILSIHALPELTALFLPLAAWLVAARAQAWSQLMAATIVTTVLALPVLVISAIVEVYVTPQFV